MHTHLLGASLLLGPSVCGAGPPLPLCGPPPLAGSPPSGCPLPPAGIAWASHSFGPPQLSLGPPTPCGPPQLCGSPPLWDLTLSASHCFRPPCVSLPPFLAPPSLRLPCFWGSPTLWGSPSMGWDFLGLPLSWTPPLFWSLIRLGAPLVSLGSGLCLTPLFSASEGFESLSLPIFCGGLQQFWATLTLYKPPLCEPPIFIGFPCFQASCSFWALLPQWASPQCPVRPSPV